MKSEINLQRTMDARDWAKEFVRINGGDEDKMIGWFANAIMVGFDIGQKGMERYQAELDIMEQI